MKGKNTEKAVLEMEENLGIRQSHFMLWHFSEITGIFIYNILFPFESHLLQNGYLHYLILQNY